MATPQRTERQTTVLDLSLDELTERVTDLGEPAYRARQVWRWIYRRFATDYDEMTDLPLALRQRLAAALPISPLHTTDVRQSDDQTTKALLRTDDHRLVEAVLMRYEDRTTVCLSSQLGCAVGCVFCQTGLTGFDRHLTTAEMLGQLVALARDAAGQGRAISNIVMMGMGEPLLNFSAVLAFLRRTTDPDAFGLGARHITVSTSGIAPKIRALADEPLQVNLAISLHATDDELRSRLVPINRRYPLTELMAACRYYAERTHRRVSFEYTLIKGVNDRPQDASALADLLHGLRCHVNLIPLNPIDAQYEEPEPATVRDFQARLERLGLPATVRYSRGRSIAAACGQLRARHESDSAPIRLAVRRPGRPAVPAAAGASRSVPGMLGEPS